MYFINLLPTGTYQHTCKPPSLSQLHYVHVQERGQRRKRLEQEFKELLRHDGYDGWAHRLPVHRMLPRHLRITGTIGCPLDIEPPIDEFLAKFPAYREGIEQG